MLERKFTLKKFPLERTYCNLRFASFSIGVDFRLLYSQQEISRQIYFRVKHQPIVNDTTLLLNAFLKRF